MTEPGRLEVAYLSDVSTILSCIEYAKKDEDVSQLIFKEIDLVGSVFAAVANLLKCDRKWKHLELSDCSNPVTVAMLISMAMLLENVQSLTFSGCEMSTLIFTAIGAALQSNTPTQSLHLDTIISSKAGVAVGTGLAGNRRLVTLDLSGCVFDDDRAITAISGGLFQNASIRTLKLSGCGLNDKQLSSFVEKALLDHPSLVELWLDGNFCRKKGLDAISKMLESKKNKLEMLSLNSQGFEGARESLFNLTSLVNALRTNTALKHLDISNNCTIAGTTRILDVLKISHILESNTSLRVLDLSNNCFDDEDLKSIIYGLKENSTLEAIQLGSNKITVEGLKEFIDSTGDMKGLKKVGFSGNELEEEGIIVLHESFPKSISIDF